MVPVAVPGAGVGRAPAVWLLDARSTRLDARGLRARARAATPGSTSPYGARSYRYPYALVAWHSEPVGVDIERIAPCNDAFAESICTPSERADPARLVEPDTYLTSLWCSKEALSKALGDAIRYDPRRLGSPMLWPGGRAGPWRAARLTVAAQHIAWLCWQSTE
jgi:4'-phosphopantetheinyl transferase superfamily